MRVCVLLIQGNGRWVSSPSGELVGTGECGSQVFVGNVCLLCIKFCMENGSFIFVTGYVGC